MVEISIETAASSAEAPANVISLNGGPIASPKVTAENVCVFYGEKQALFNVNIRIANKSVTAFIGPSGCGKSTFLRCINRMNDTIASARVPAKSEMTGQNIYSPDVDPVHVRARIGMVFQKPNPFPKTIYENVAYGRRIQGLAKSKGELRKSSLKACNARVFSTKSRIACTARARDFPAANSSAFALPAPSPSAPKSF